MEFWIISSYQKFESFSIKITWKFLQNSYVDEDYFNR